MKLLLINPARFFRDSYILPPMHLLCIAQAARRVGHQAEIIDIPYLLNTCANKYRIDDNSILDLIFSKEFDIMGIGSVVSSYSYCEKLVMSIREKHPGMPIIMGGSIGLPIKDIWERYAPVDYLCESDGELVIQQFLNSYPHDMVAVRRVAGLHYLNEQGKYVGNKIDLPKDLDYLPFLDYDEIDVEYFINNMRRWIKNVLGCKYEFGEHERFLPISMSRGCVYECTFCFHFHHLHRRHSPKYIVDYIEFLMKKYKVTAFQVIDDLLIINKAWLHEVCDEIIRRKLNIGFFSSGGKPNIIDKELLIKMRKAGFKRISYGVESGSQTILDIMKKQATVSDNYRAVKWTQKAGISSTVNIVYGMPGENEHTMNETRDFLISLDLNTKEYYGALATPYPGAPLYDYVKEKGIVPDTHEYLLNLGGYGDYRLNLTQMPKENFLRKVSTIQYEVDRAYYWKRRQYIMLVKLSVKHILRSVYQYLPARLRIDLRARVTKLFTKRMVPHGWGKMILRMIKKAIVKLFNLIGYNLIFSKNKIQSLVVVDKFFWEPYWNPNRMMQLYFKGLKQSRNEQSDNFYKQLRFYSLQQMVYYVLRQKLRGDFAECGAWKGHSAYIISSILAENGFLGDFHIFDSFEGGLSARIEKDKNLVIKLSEKRIKEESNSFRSTEDEVRSCLSNFIFFHLYNGWIPTRFNEVEDKKFSFVHIDVDLYQPTLDSINFFYPRLVDGGVIICDDYGGTQFSGAKKAIDEFLEKNNYKIFYEVPMGSCFIIK